MDSEGLDRRVRAPSLRSSRAFSESQHASSSSHVRCVAQAHLRVATQGSCSILAHREAAGAPSGAFARISVSLATVSGRPELTCSLLSQARLGITHNGRVSHVVRAAAVADKGGELASMRQVCWAPGSRFDKVSHLPKEHATDASAAQVIEHLLARKDLTAKQAENALEVLFLACSFVPRPSSLTVQCLTRALVPAAAPAQGCRPGSDRCISRPPPSEGAIPNSRSCRARFRENCLPVSTDGAPSSSYFYRVRPPARSPASPRRCAITPSQ